LKNNNSKEIFFWAKEHRENFEMLRNSELFSMESSKLINYSAKCVLKLPPHQPFGGGGGEFLHCRDKFFGKKMEF
jgi:hypothetical protein